MKVTIDYKVYEARSLNHLSVRELSKKSGVSKTMINDIENNKTNPTLLVICQLAACMNMKPEDLYSYSIE
jgi:Predicted transcriptional regulators